MFTKLLKHEWRATRGMLGTLCLICLGASLLGGGTMRYLMIASSQDAQQNVIVVLNVLAMVAAMIAVAVVGVAALFLYIGRFYKSRFTDEGYLTFTLPVSTHQNLLASMANTAIGMVITFFAISMAEIMTGSIIIEQVFTVPGIGRLLLTSINNRDYPVVQAIVVILAAWIVIVNFVADLLYQLVDPRIRLR